MELFNILKSLEVNEEIHLARLLILIHEFSNEDRKGEVEGLTKLAKLDFLLRYPAYLERALIKLGKNSKVVNIKDFEKTSVEARMVRFKYGPWDFRYRNFLNILVAKGLAYIRVEGRSYRLGLTTKGNEVATVLQSTPSFNDIALRAKTIRRNFDISGTNLMKFVYETFPEITTLQYGNEITL